MEPKLGTLAGFWLMTMVLAGCTSSPALSTDSVRTLVENPASPSLGIQIVVTSVQGQTRTFRLYCPDLGPVVVRGTVSDGTEGLILEFESLEWFSTWPGGWTEVSFLLEGELALTTDRTSGIEVVDLQTTPKLDAVRSAAIRYYDSYVRGVEGEREFSLRWKRIQAVCHDLAVRFNGPNLARQPELIKRSLFPEVFDPEAVLPVSSYSFQGGQRWNLEYSRQILSEGLQKLRDDGTLFRDYQESPGLWQLALVWDDFWQHHGRSAALRQIEKPHKTENSNAELFPQS